jgi:hypothetical protein
MTHHKIDGIERCRLRSCSLVNNLRYPHKINNYLSLSLSSRFIVWKFQNVKIQLSGIIPEDRSYLLIYLISTRHKLTLR